MFCMSLPLSLQSYAAFTHLLSLFIDDMTVKLVSSAVPEPRLTDQGANTARHVHHAAARKVSEAELPEPAALRPAPVHRDRVEEARHDGAEDDVAVEVATLCDGAGDDGGASGGEGALE